MAWASLSSLPIFLHGTRHPWNHPLNHLLNHLLNRLNLAPTWLTCSKARRLSGPLSWNPAKKKPSRERLKTIAQKSPAIWFLLFDVGQQPYLIIKFYQRIILCCLEGSVEIVHSTSHWSVFKKTMVYKLEFFQGDILTRTNLIVKLGLPSRISSVVFVFDNGLQPWIFSRWHFN